MADWILIPTARLRWVYRDGVQSPPHKFLQQWWAQDLPSYMRQEAVGEWRDVEVVSESG